MRSTSVFPVLPYRRTKVTYSGNGLRNIPDRPETQTYSATFQLEDRGPQLAAAERPVAGWSYETNN